VDPEVEISRSRNGGSVEGGAIEVAMTDEMAVVFAEVSGSLCQRGLKFVLGEVLVVEHDVEK
jgi:hypothetical protein